MKTVGLIGGMSWESTQTYYRVMNEYVQNRLGGHNSVEAIIYSLNFEKALSCASEGKWPLLAEEFVGIAQRLESAGADFLVIASNTAHIVFDEVERQVSIPILHVLDPVVKKIESDGIKAVRILSTKNTAQEGFYKKRIEKKCKAKVLPFEEKDQDLLDKIIFEELVYGKISSSSKTSCLKVIEKLVARGASGIILGCSELGLLLQKEDLDVALYDTALLHAKACGELACQ